LAASVERKAVTDDTYERGVQIRQEIFGKELTDAQLANADDFNRLIQDLVTRYCFGEVWGRELLPRKIRSMLTIAMLAALGRDNEIRVHVRGALANGVTREEIGEVLLHAAIYAGVPAGVSGFRCAGEVFAEIDAAEAGAPS
jgi:4-carboxymuconolactone decarboxylase